MKEKTKVSTFRVNQFTTKLFEMHPDQAMSRSLNTAVERYLGIMDQNKKALKIFKAAERKHLVEHLTGYINGFASIMNSPRYIQSTESKKIDTKILADKMKSLDVSALVSLIESLGL